MKNDVEQKHEWKFDDWKGERQKESERERMEQARGEERQGIGADVSQEIWRNERSRGRSWRTKLSNEFPLLLEYFLCISNIIICQVMSVTVTYPLFSYNPALYSPRDQIVGTGAAVKTIDDVGCRVRDGKSAIGTEFSPKVCKWREKRERRRRPRSSPHPCDG